MKRAGFLGFLLAALLLRVSIPTGFMVAAAEGGPSLVPCPSAWDVPIAAPAMHHGGHHGKQPQHDHKAQEPPCPFGVLLFPALPSAPPMLAVRLLTPEPLPPPQLAGQVQPRSPDHLHPPATGPPLHA